MISNHLSMVEKLRPDAESISARVALYLAAGGKITQGESPAINPLPAERSTKIDPETILKRRPKALSRSERQALRKMADSL